MCDDSENLNDLVSMFEDESTTLDESYINDIDELLMEDLFDEDEEDDVLSALLASNCDNLQNKSSKEESNKNSTQNRISNIIVEKPSTSNINVSNPSTSNDESFDAAFGIRIRYN